MLVADGSLGGHVWDAEVARRGGEGIGGTREVVGS